MRNLCNSLGWSPPSDDRDLADFLFEKLTGFGPLELLIQSISGNAVPLVELQRRLFGDSPFAERATAALLALATFAKRQHDKRVLLPTRLHMFFRGLPALFACVNPLCGHAREHHPHPILGRLHTHARERCHCGGRVYELATHRECGTAFLRGYMDGPHGDFLWHLPSGPLREGHQAPLLEVQFLVDGEPHRDETDQCTAAWLDIRSGRLLYQRPADAAGFREVYLPGGGAGKASGAFVNSQHRPVGLLNDEALLLHFSRVAARPALAAHRRAVERELRTVANAVSS